MIDYERFRAVTRDLHLPTALVDLDAIDHNTRVLNMAMQGTTPTLRIASKSIRHVWLMRYIAERCGDRALGWMTFGIREVEMLVEQGLDDFLMGYPFGRADEAETFARLVKDGVHVIAQVDHVDQLPVLEEAAKKFGVTLPLCLDIDASWRPGSGKMHFGVRRSPIRDLGTARTVGDRIGASDHLELTALLAYEAQIAGMQDKNRGSRHLDPVRQWIKKRSRPVVLELRREIVDGLRADGHPITVVNGGGTGSIDWTARDPSVTEVTAGSGFLCPHLFDGYRQLDLKPAAFFALSVVRTSDPDHVTCAGGGYIASGPAAPDRMPIVHAPEGLEPLGMEGFGEVQTPLKVLDGASRPKIGDPVICRHAKSGEIFERFAEAHFFRGDQILETHPSYRGLGGCFM